MVKIIQINHFDNGKIGVTYDGEIIFNGNIKPTKVFVQDLINKDNVSVLIDNKKEVEED